MTYTKERAQEECEKIQQCPNCKGWYSAYSPPICFACATGLAQSGRSKGYHPEA
jgi:hypothetical protein